MAASYCKWINVWILPVILHSLARNTLSRRLLRSVDQELDKAGVTNSVEFIWGTTTVAVGDTAVLHCSFDAIFQQLRNGNINWMKETTKADTAELDKNTAALETVDGSATWIASGKKVMVDDSRYRVYRPHNSALSVLIIRRSKKKDAGVYRCNLSGSRTRHKFMILNVTESKIEAQTSPATMRTKIGTDVMLWCNATGYPKPVVYWTREDRNRKLPDGSYQFWGNGLPIKNASERETGIYACFLDNFVQPIVSYKFSLMVEDNPWNLEGYKMRFDSKQWHTQDSSEPKPMRGRSFLLMCETRGATKPLPIIRWYRNGKALRNGRHFYIIEDMAQSRSSYTSSTLVIMNFLTRFQGNYTCVASNVFRMKKQTFYIQGYVEPKDAEGVQEENDDLDEDEMTDEDNQIMRKDRTLLPNISNTTSIMIPANRKSPIKSLPAGLSTGSKDTLARREKVADKNKKKGNRRKPSTGLPAQSSPVAIDDLKKLLPTALTEVQRNESEKGQVEMSNSQSNFTKSKPDNKDQVSKGLTVANKDEARKGQQEVNKDQTEVKKGQSDVSKGQSEVSIGQTAVGKDKSDDDYYDENGSGGLDEEDEDDERNDNNLNSQNG